MAASITRLNPPTMPDSLGAGYSQISIAEPGRFASVSGQVAWTRDGKPLPATLPGQAEMAVRNAKAALEALGATARDLLIVRVYVVDLDEARLAELWPSILHLFDGEQPCVTGIGVAALAGPGLQVEIEMTVRVPD